MNHEYLINVTQIEELQTIQNRDALDQIFSRAERMIIGGGTVVLVRKYANGKSDKFDEFSTEQDLANYKKNVYKYL
ncbi:hypothetical protein V9K67_12115 [Paraflavisolibacter sp. H34]|uniref:hypothetical protein n=1 Tax=Huijunlia imazamoxiresistens TaxID=3127457 RepID=UPI0030172A68